MSEVFDSLKAALADRHSIERELGSGGMATYLLTRRPITKTAACVAHCRYEGLSI